MTKEQALWDAVRKESIQSVATLEKQLIFQKAVLELAEKKCSEAA